MDSAKSSFKEQILPLVGAWSFMLVSAIEIGTSLSLSSVECVCFDYQQ